MPPLVDANEGVDVAASSEAGGGLQTLKASQDTSCSDDAAEVPSMNSEPIKNNQPNTTFDNLLETFQIEHLVASAGGGEEDSTSGYFAKSDFSVTNWEDASGYIPPIGLAVACGSLAICAPITFVVSAVAAVGSVHLAAAAYESCVGNSCGCMCEDDNDGGCDIGVETPPVNKNNKGEGMSQITFTMDEEDSESHSDVASVHCHNPSVLQTREQVLEWTELYYPKLDKTARENMEFVGLNALEFFEVFFDNDAPYTLKEYQRRRGDVDLQYGHWEKLDHVQQPSLHTKANLCSGLPSLVRERVLNFKVKNISPFGPPYVPATKVQRALVASKRLMVLESKNSVSGVPLSDRFFVLERWVVTAEKIEGRYHLRVSIYSQTFFTQKCPFESQIVSKSEASFKDIANQWYSMAQDALKKTEKARSRRINRMSNVLDGHEDSSIDTFSSEQEVENDNKENYPKDESVEVRHFGRCKSWVVGDDEPANEPPLKHSTNSLGRASRSIIKYVRRRSSDLSFRKFATQNSA